jgi:alpha-tubulin suppressor-like RCC1 family protein
VIRKSVLSKAGAGLVVAAMLLMAACSSGGSSSGQKPSALFARPSATAHSALPGLAASSTSARPASPSPAGILSSSPVSRPSPAETVRHWGAFFGAAHGVNYDLETSPTALTLPAPVVQVASSNSDEYALLTNGSVYAWGLGTAGELGDGTWHNSLTKPVRVQFPPGVQIAWLPTDVMPYDTAFAVDTSGRVWGWGNNGGGELCLGNTRAYDTPVQLPLLGVTSLAGASNHALYDSGNTVYACGQNLEGSLGDGSFASSTTPVRVRGLDGSSVIELVAAFANAGALLSDGEYFDWGYNHNGQLGDGHAGRPSDVPVRALLPHPVTEIAQGGSIWNNGQTLALLSDGSLWSWGDDSDYQLGNGALGMQALPVRFYTPPGVIYESLATGSATSYAVSTAGNVYAWGVSFVGQLGDGTFIPASAPVLVASGASAISATANNVVIGDP